MARGKAHPSPNKDDRGMFCRESFLRKIMICLYIMTEHFFLELGDLFGRDSFEKEIEKIVRQYSENSQLPEHLLQRIQKRYKNTGIPLREKPFIVRYLQTEYDQCLQIAETIIIRALDGDNKQLDKAQELLERAKIDHLYSMSIGGPSLHAGIDRQDLYGRMIFYVRKFPQAAKDLSALEQQIRQTGAETGPEKTAEAVLSLVADRNKIICDYLSKHPIQG